MAALLLGARVTPFIPGPDAARDRAAAEVTAMAVPRFVELLESWRWSEPLWRAGVIAGGFEGDAPAADIATAHARVEAEPWLAPLRALARPRVFEDERSRLDAVARDLLRAGPDPSISLPVAAGLDAFAARHGLMVARAEATSLAQRAEARLALGVAAFAAPVLLQAPGERVLEARDALAEELDALRAAAAEGDPTEVRDAARLYADAFEAASEELLRPADDEREPRIIAGTVACSIVRLPADAVLRSSVFAARQAVGGRRAAELPAPPPTLTASIVVRVVGRTARPYSPA
jgi:hypothetical protein